MEVSEILECYRKGEGCAAEAGIDKINAALFEEYVEAPFKYVGMHTEGRTFKYKDRPDCDAIVYASAGHGLLQGIQAAKEIKEVLDKSPHQYLITWPIEVCHAPDKGLDVYTAMIRVIPLKYTMYFEDLKDIQTLKQYKANNV